MTLVSVDPGLRHAGVAAFEKGALVYAALIKNTERKARGPQAWWAMAEEVATTRHAGSPIFLIPDVYVVEVPQVYRFGKSKGDPDDLIQLAGVGGAIGARLQALEAHGYYPRQWKGQVPKDVMAARIESYLNAAELSAIAKCAPSLRHNVLDAIGIGLYHLGRMGGRSAA